MKLCRVVGNVVAAAQHAAFDGHKLMMVRPEDPQGNAMGAAYLAIDQIDAGPGDRVIVLSEGTGLRQLVGQDAGPIRSIIVGIVDAVDAGS